MHLSARNFTGCGSEGVKKEFIENKIDTMNRYVFINKLSAYRQ